MRVAAPTFAEIYAQELDHVWRTLRRFGVEARHLEDVAQEVFLIVHRRLADYDPTRPIRPWISGIAYKVAADHRGRAVVRKEAVTGEALDRPDERPVADELIERAERRSLVQRALDELDPNKRAVFVMHDLDGDAVPEIAAALGIPLNTAYSRLRLARAQMVATLRQLKQEDAG
jgi:RNA polymerase sigma-70 factor (ECF subfamily)